MKKQQVEITVQRVYTTTCWFELDPDVTEQEIHRAVVGDFDLHDSKIGKLYDKFYDEIGEEELEQCDVELISFDVAHLHVEENLDIEHEQRCLFDDDYDGE
jgi:hypothetical protein